jgi:eukaryotic-like serine/threonine-protein kinase
VLRLGGQIADALDRAHRAGMVHRDLKPGNVMLTKSGAKLMDFGLARATGLAGPGGGSGAGRGALTQSPTVAQPLTAEGTIIGTFQYMAPEQLEGREADARSDLWALGCVLYEMATGRRAFEGVSQASLIGSIMKDEPRPISERTPMSPPALDRLVGALLAKDPAERIQTAHDVRLQLGWIADGGAPTSGVAAAVVRSKAPAWRAWLIPTAVALAAVAVTAAVVRRPVAPAPSFEFTLEPPAGTTFGFPADPALSPDGRTVACVVADAAGQTRLALRPLERAETRLLAGTEDASLPFWSPDGKAIGYFAQGKLRRVGLDGSPPVTLADAADGRGAAWSRDGVILFAPGSSGVICRVPATGGDPVRITTLDPGRGEMAHRYPSFVGDGGSFLYVSLAKDGKKWLCAGSVDGGPGRVLRETESAARTSVPGWVLSVERRRLMAQRLDQRSLAFEGSPLEIAQVGATGKIGYPNLGTDAGGTVVYQQELKFKAWLRWHDATGAPLGERMRELDSPQEVALSPDLRRVAVVMGDEGDLWLLDLDHPVPTRLTFFNATQYGALYALAWSPDSKRIAYSLEVGTINDVIHVISVEGSRDAVLFSPPALFASNHVWSPDGRSLVTILTTVAGGQDIWTVPVDEPNAATLYEATPDDEQRGALSPDGRWLACLVGVTGRQEIRILSYPKPGERYQLALGSAPVYGVLAWSGDGRTLVFIDSDRHVVAVDVRLDGGFRQGEPRVLFTLPPDDALVAISPDLKRFLLFEREHVPNLAPLRVLTAWPERLPH